MKVDILPQAEGPALSSTSDFPVYERGEPVAPVTPATKPEPVVAAEATPAVSPAVSPAEPAARPADKPAETPEAKAAAEAKATADKKAAEDAAAVATEKTAADKRAEHAVARKAAEEQARVANEALREAMKLVDRLTREGNEKKLAEAEAADPKPKRETFDSPDAHEQALIEWAGRSAGRKREAAAEAAKVEEAAKAEKAKTDKEAADKAGADQARQINENWAKRQAEAQKEHPDYDEVVTKSPVQISDAVLNATLNADNGPAIAYHLAKNPAEAARLNALNPLQAAIEIGKLSAAVAVKPPAQVSQAPDPIVPLAAASERATTKGPEEETGDEYYARRNGEIQAARAARYH